MKHRMLGILITLAGFSVSAGADEQQPLSSYKQLTPETALEITTSALEACRDAGYQVTVAVVDRMGVAQAMVRDRYAGPHTPDTAVRKAWTAVSFRTDTLTLSEATGSGMPQAGARFITNALMIGGGVPITSAGTIVAGVGVSGAPTGLADDACARTGIAAVEEKLEF